MTIDPKVTFWFGVWTTVLLGVGGGTVHLTNMFPVDWIPYIVAWSNALGFINSSILTAMSGLSSNKSGPLVTK